MKQLGRSVGLALLASLSLQGCGDDADGADGDGASAAAGAAAGGGGSPSAMANGPRDTAGTGSGSGRTTGGSGSGGANEAGTAEANAGAEALPAFDESGSSCAIPAEALPEDTSHPDQVVGDGSPGSCTADAFITAVDRGGVITFDCGLDPVTITLDRPAKVRNDASDIVVIDGGGLVTLSGGGSTRILYMNTCDPDQVWTTDHCQDQDHPRLTVQNLTFIDADSRSEDEYDGGGAIWVRGGRFKIINSRFFGNVCHDEGPDVGGAAARVFSQYQGQPVYVVSSVFGAEGRGNVCANGGAISSIGVSWSIFDSEFTYNRAIGNGGNPAQSGTPGGGSGGAIYNDGQTMTLSLCGTRIENNEVNTHGSAIFFISNNHDGTLRIEDSTIRNNRGGSWYEMPGISMHDDTVVMVDNSTIE